MLKKIEKEKQLIAKTQNSLTVEKLKKRKAETRRKIELDGLVVKAGIDRFNKAVILGTLSYGLRLILQDANYQTLFESIGDDLFRQQS